MDSFSNNSSRILLNLGCGPFVKQTRWQDFDGSWNVLASRLPLGLGWIGRKLSGHGGTGFPIHVRYVNITKHLPFADQSVDAVYFSHVLEHLYLDEGRHLLGECRRVLKPGGIVRVVVPDTEHYVRTYLKRLAEGRTDACFELNNNLWFRPLSGKKGLLQRFYTALTDFHSHKFMYDRAYLADCLKKIGFVSVKEAQYLVSAIPEISDVELEDRIGKGLGFGVEAINPAVS